MTKKNIIVTGKLLDSGCLVLSVKDVEKLGLYFGDNLITGIVKINKSNKKSTRLEKKFDKR